MPRQSVGRTFLVAMSLLGLVALAQLAEVTRRALQPGTAPVPAVTPAAASASTPANGAAGEPAAPSQAAAESAIVADAAVEQLAADAEKRLLASLPKPTPVPRRREITPEMRVNGLVNLARTLRDRGDTSTALTRLREAQVIAPSNALIISEMAITYEKMGLTDKAIEQWRRIYEFGEQAGIYYSAAEAKLRAIQLPDPAAPVSPEGGLDGGAWRQEAGFQEPPLFLGNVGTTDDTGNSQPLRRLKLRVPIAARPGNRIEVHDVVIQVYFYDQLKDGAIVETNADVTSSWVRRPSEEGEAPVDWSTPEPEVLEVGYVQPEIDPKDPEAREPRNYFGYVVRVYYKGELNATRAEPVKLLNQFPPPQILQTSDLPQ